MIQLAAAPHGELLFTHSGRISADPDDKCPADPETKNGFEDSDGRPDALPKAAKQFNGVIAGIEFELNKGSIRSSSFVLLDQAARIIASAHVARARTSHSSTRRPATHGRRIVVSNFACFSSRSP